jgi:hypothetical protein
MWVAIDCRSKILVAVLKSSGSTGLERYHYTKFLGLNVLIIVTLRSMYVSLASPHEFALVAMLLILDCVKVMNAAFRWLPTA